MSTRPAQYASGLGFSKGLQTGDMKVFLNYLLHERKLGSQKKKKVKHQKQLPDMHGYSM